MTLTYHLDVIRGQIVRMDRAPRRVRWEQMGARVEQWLGHSLRHEYRQGSYPHGHVRYARYSDGYTFKSLYKHRISIGRSYWVPR
jgi:hypothetical protein